MSLTDDFDEDDEDLDYTPTSVLPTKPVHEMFTVPEMPKGIPTAAIRRTHLIVSRADAELASALDGMPPDQRTFLIALASFGTESRACMEASIPKATVREWKKDPVFNQALARSSEIIADILEEELMRRALTGSDKLLIEAVRAHKPDKYSPKTSADINLKGSVVHSWADLAKAALTGTIEDVEYEEV